MSAAKFEPVFGNEGAGNGTMNVIRSGNRIVLKKGEEAVKTELATGLVTEGTYIGSAPNKFNPEKLDYTIREADGTLTVLNGTASLANQMSRVALGDLVQIVYNGRRNIKRKAGGMASMHDFKVLRAAASEDTEIEG